MPHPAISATARTTRAPALPPDERRRAIVDAVLPLLVERGARVTTREIAEAAGLAEGTLFRVFEDKTALLHAAAHSLLDPERTRRSLADVDPGLDLEQMVAAVVEQLLHSTGRAFAVLMALRGSAPPPGSGGGQRRHGPPEFVRESHRAVLEGLTELFARHADELRVEPRQAALVLCALLFGGRLPWAEEGTSLSADEISSVLLHGIGRR